MNRGELGSSPPPRTFSNPSFGKSRPRSWERFDWDLALFPRRTTKFLFSLTKLQLVRVRDSSSTVPIDVPVLRGITETLGAKLALNSRSFQFAETPNNRRLKTRVRKREKDWLGDGANRDEKEHEQTNLPHLLFVIPTSD